jgi:hypothetical protein
MNAMTRPEMSVSEPTLYVAFELGKKDWKLAMTSGFGVQPWLRTVPSRDWSAVARALAQGRARFGLPAAAPVVSCYEAGRDGFWIHRALLAMGIANRVVDSASIEVNRRARRAKTDRLDALKLVTMLVRVCCGERRVWSEVRVPTVAEEAARHVSRERTALTQDQTRLVNQMRGWLATWGTTLPARRRSAWWTTLRDWAGTPLPVEVQARPGDADRGARGPAAGRGEGHGARGVAAIGAAQRRGDDECVGVARRGVGMARVPESAADWGAARVCADAVRQRGVETGARHQSRRQCAVAGDQHSARVELGAVATAECADPVVSGEFRHGETGSAHRDRRARAEAGHRTVAVCDDRRRPRGSHHEDRVDSVCASHARGAYGSYRVAVAATATKEVPPLTCPD